MTKEIKSATAITIKNLWNNGNYDTAVLSALRQSKQINDHHAALAYPILFRYLPTNSLNENGNVTYGETAIFTSLHLFALYQQSEHQKLLYKRYNYKDPHSGTTLMKALSQLRQDDKLQKALDRRVQILLMSNNINSVINSLNHLILILKAKANPKPLIDFADLAQDLYQWQIRKGTFIGSRKITLKWGQQYFVEPNSKKTEN